MQIKLCHLICLFHCCCFLCTMSRAFSYHFAVSLINSIGLFNINTLLVQVSDTIFVVMISVILIRTRFEHSTALTSLRFTFGLGLFRFWLWFWPWFARRLWCLGEWEILLSCCTRVSIILNFWCVQPNWLSYKPWHRWDFTAKIYSSTHSRIITIIKWMNKMQMFIQLSKTKTMNGWTLYCEQLSYKA